MAKKTIEVFSVSFLDLLSGALGAVILLYVIIPRMTISVEEFEAQKKLKAEMERLGLQLDQLKGAIPKDLSAKLTSQIAEIQNANNDLQARITQAQQDLNTCIEEQRSNEEQMTALEAKIAQANEAQKKCAEDMDKLSGALKFLVVTIQWNTAQDVDLHIQKPDGSYYVSGDDDAQSSATKDDRWGPGLELWQTNTPQAGTYRIYANLFSRNGGKDLNNDGADDEVSSIVYDNPTVKMRVYYRNGFKEFAKVLTRPTFVDRRQALGGAAQRAASKATAELFTTLTVSTNGDITFN